MIHVFTFRATAPTTVNLGVYSGIVVRGIFFRMLERESPELGAEVHGFRGLSPYSVSPIEDVRRSRVFFDRVPGGVEFQFRIVTFDEAVSEAVRKFILGDTPIIRLKGIASTLSTVTVNSIEHDFSDKSVRDPDSFEVVFRTPTFFRETQRFHGLFAFVLPRRFRRVVKPIYRYVIVPDPYHLFRGLVRLYRKFCNPNFRYSSYCEWLQEGGVALETYHDLHVVKVWDSDSRWYRGFMGRAIFSIPKDLYDPKMAKLTHTLLKFARYSNVGGNRTAGFGVVDYSSPTGDGHLIPTPLGHNILI